MTAGVLDPRAWNPSGPHIGPDDDDLAMLDQGDLGSAILALHRVGAAACEAVLRAPLPDDYALIEALAKARAEVAQNAVSAVNKCVGGDESYADVLAKEIFDGAEQGALLVYRTCVSKAVAPPLAVQRAGLVYGVPPDSMGRYLSIAANPQAHPIALADEADRTLLAWAADVVREESAPVSKAILRRGGETVGEYNRTPFGQEHPKGEKGRFVTVLERPAGIVSAEGRPAVAREPGRFARWRRQGYGEQAAPEVAGAPAPPVTVAEPPAPVRAPTRTSRTSRVSRTSRTSHQSRTSEPTMAVNMMARMSPKLAKKMSARMGSKLQAQMQAQREETSDEDFGGLSYSLRYFSKPTREWSELPNDLTLAWAVDTRDASSYLAAAGGGEIGEPGNPKWVRIGGIAEREQDPADAEGDAHTMALTHLAGDQEANKLPSRLIPRRELEEVGVDPYDGAAVMEYAKEKGYFEDLARDPEHGFSNRIAATYGAVAQSAQKRQAGDWYAVLKPEPELSLYHGQEVSRVPLIAEMVLATDPGSPAMRGEVDYTRGQPTYRVDPEQTYEVVNMITLWDEDRNTFVDRYHLRPVDPNDIIQKRAFGKAVLTRERRGALVAVEPRDREGRWMRVRDPDAPPALVQPVAAPVAVPARLGRQSRASRKSRVTRQGVPVQAQQGKARMKARSGTKMSPKLKAALKAVMAQRAEKTPAKPVGDFPLHLDDRPIHKVMSSEQWDTFLDSHAPLAATDAREIPLTLTATHALVAHQRDNLDDLGVVAELAENVVKDTFLDMAPVKDFKSRIIEDADAHVQLNKLLDDVDNYMASHQEIVHVQLRTVETNEEEGWSAVQVYANEYRPPPQTLIFMPEDFDPDQPLTLKHLGFARRDDLTYGKNQIMMDRAAREHAMGNWYDAELQSDTDDPDQVVIDPRVSVFRADQQLWQARQD